MNILIDNDNPYWPALYLPIDENSYYVVRSGGAMQGDKTIGWIRFEVEELSKYMYDRLESPIPKQLYKYITHIFETEELEIDII
jgi:hypothetical protein